MFQTLQLEISPSTQTSPNPDSNIRREHRTGRAGQGGHGGQTGQGGHGGAGGAKQQQHRPAARVDPCATAVLCDDFDAYAARRAPGGKWATNENNGSIAVDTTRAHSGANR